MPPNLTIPTVAPQEAQGFSTGASQGQANTRIFQTMRQTVERVRNVALEAHTRVVEAQTQAEMSHGMAVATEGFDNFERARATDQEFDQFDKKFEDESALLFENATSHMKTARARGRFNQWWEQQSVLRLDRVRDIADDVRLKWSAELFRQDANAAISRQSRPQLTTIVDTAARTGVWAPDKAAAILESGFARINFGETLQLALRQGTLEDAISWASSDDNLQMLDAGQKGELRDELVAIQKQQREETKFRREENWREQRDGMFDDYVGRTLTRGMLSPGGKYQQGNAKAEHMEHFLNLLTRPELLRSDQPTVVDLLRRWYDGEQSNDQIDDWMTLQLGLNLSTSDYEKWRNRLDTRDANGFGRPAVDLIDRTYSGIVRTLEGQGMAGNSNRIVNLELRRFQAMQSMQDRVDAGEFGSDSNKALAAARALLADTGGELSLGEQAALESQTAEALAAGEDVPGIASPAGDVMLNLVGTILGTGAEAAVRGFFNVADLDAATTTARQTQAGVSITPDVFFSGVQQDHQGVIDSMPMRWVPAERRWERLRPDGKFEAYDGAAWVELR